MTTNTLQETLDAELKTAMKAKEKLTTSVIRSIKAAVKKLEIDKKIILDDGAVLEVIQKQIKQRNESIKIYQDNQRTDLADKEQAELAILNTFMPKQFTQDELTDLIRSEVAEVGATSMKDMGKVMQAVKEKVAGKADPADVSKIVKSILGS